jgi:hydroxymethylbilane synthase
MPSKLKMRLATRGSDLALFQANRVVTKIRSLAPHVTVEIITITTSADRQADRPLREFGDKALFVKEIEEAILSGRADAGVHSMKDLPGALPRGLRLAAIPERENPFDALLLHGKKSLAELPPESTVATSSLRRQGQLLRMRPDLKVVPVRGNIDTRVRKLQEDQFAGLILAVAGLSRLNLSGAITEIFSAAHMIPASGQGAIGIETPTQSLFDDVWKRIDNPAARIAVETERSFIRTLGADCRTPAACLCAIEHARMHLQGMVCSGDGKRYLRTEQTSPLAESARCAKAAANELLSRGGREILDGTHLPTDDES